MSVQLTIEYFNIENWLISNEKFESIINLFSIDEQTKIRKYKFIKDRKHTLIGKLLIMNFISKSITKKLNISEIKFEVSKYGKPSLSQECKDNLLIEHLEYNISHHGDYVCLIATFNKNIKLGIDLTQVNLNNLASTSQDLIKDFKTEFHIEEFNFLINCPQEFQLNLFMELWALKESYIKMLGKGLSFNISELNFKINKPLSLIEESCIFGDIQLKLKNILSDCRFYLYFINDYIIAVCIQSDFKSEYNIESIQVYFKDFDFI